VTPDRSSLVAHNRVTRTPRRRPRTARALVARPRLIRRLSEARDTPIALLTAPAGYGKTTLLAEWAERDERPFAWVRPGRGPDALVAGVAEALRDAGLVEAPAARFDHPEPGDQDGRLAALLEEAAGAGPFVVVVDDGALDQDRARAVADVAYRLREGVTIALAARRQPELPVGRLHAHRLAVELGPRELAMTRMEVAMLLDATGVRLGAAQVDELLARTRGWPVALSLAALTLGADDGAAVASFSGTDRLFADYVRSDILGELGAACVAFLRRTSVLDRLTAPLCDAVLEATGSAAMLDELERRNLPVTTDEPVFGVRLHPLLTEMLRAELARREPELEPVLRGRAADWLSEHGQTREALAQAIGCRDPLRSGRLLWSLAPGCAARGELGSLGRWIARFDDRVLSAQPELALTAGFADLADGRRDRAERWADAAARADAPPAVASAARMMRACIAREGMRAMAADAREACVRLPDAARSLGHFLDGVAHELMGDRDTAAVLLDEAARRAGGEAPLVNAHAHAQLALLAVDGADWELAAAEVAAARAALSAVAPEAPLRALVLAVGAAVDAQGGEVGRARADAHAARRLLTALAGFTPWYLVEARIWLARAEIRMSDAAAARGLLAAAARTLAAIPDAPVLRTWLHDAWERADAFAAGAVGDGPALTKAELRVLRFLPSHLSFKEIGARLHVSTNTVKTQALAVYRKLDVSCRSDAVARGRAIGLLDA
jgi:LuxR family transcriptional regulator, maltose regulon positive regulatory protein